MKPKRLKLTRSQVSQLEMLADHGAVSEAKSVTVFLDAGTIILSPQSISRLTEKGLSRSKIKGPGRRPLTHYWLTAKGIAEVKRRRVGFFRQSDLEEFTGKPKRRAA